jgi:hypothetical protein
LLRTNEIYPPIPFRYVHILQLIKRANFVDGEMFKKQLPFAFNEDEKRWKIKTNATFL